MAEDRLQSLMDSITELQTARSELEARVRGLSECAAEQSQELEQLHTQTKEAEKELALTEERSSEASERVCSLEVLGKVAAEKRGGMHNSFAAVTERETDLRSAIAEKNASSQAAVQQVGGRLEAMGKGAAACVSDLAFVETVRCAVRSSECAIEE